MDDMSRLNRIEEFWNWLPAFRAVAETEHVGEASENVHKSPSALSRAVSLLEDDFGVELFERAGRQIQLTDAGRDFLSIVRKSMRLVDEGMRRVAEADSIRHFYLASSQQLGWTLEAAMGSLTATIEGTDLHVSTSAQPNPRQRVLQGDLDLLVTHAPIGDEKIETKHITDLSNVICGPPHHDEMETAVDAAETLERAEFVAPVEDGTEQPVDGWPPEFDRNVACRVSRPQTAARVAAEANLLAVLPKRFVESNEAATADLEIAESDALRDTPIYAARRMQLVDDDLAAETLDRLATAPPFRPDHQ